jgi:arylsulfatase A-like enzyme
MSHTQPKDRPNLLLITTDQQRWDFLSLYGTSGLHTPNLDRLAREGVYLPNTYCTMPTCTPTRVSLLNGQYPSRHGAYSIGVLTRFDFPTLPGLLGEAGYHTSIVGKTHFVPRNMEAAHVAGIDPPPALPGSGDYREDDGFWDTFDGPYVGFQSVRHMAGHTSGRKPREHYRAWLRRIGADTDAIDSLHEVERGTAGAWALPQEYSQTAWITAEAGEIIERRQRADGPWFSWVSYQDPHPPYICPEPYYSNVDMTDVSLGGAEEGEFDGKPEWYAKLCHEGIYEHGCHDFYDPKFGCPNTNPYRHVHEPDKAIRAYIGMCNMVDAYIGKLLDRLRAAGALENTLIAFTADHGDYLGRHGFWQKGLPAYDDAQRVPMILWWPAGTPDGPRGRCESLLSLVDLPQTFLSAAGVEADASMQGIDQMPLLRGESEAPRDWVLVECEPTHRVFQHTLVAEGHKLVVYRDDSWGELYDLRSDPDQRENLWDRPGSAEVRLRLLHRLAQANLQKDGCRPPRIWNA